MSLKAIVIAAVVALIVAAGGYHYARGSDSAPAGADALNVVVHKTPWCGCCSDWVEHLRQHGMAVTVHEHDDLEPIKARLGVPAPLGSCHTAEVAGYVIEGHVPASEIERLVDQRDDDVRGLAVPGMPAGSPGMEMPGRVDEYAVLAFDDDSVRVFARYRGGEKL